MLPLTWPDIAWLRSITHMPIVLKGIMTGEDAALAVEHGIDGIVVSNHGGRQVDGAIASLDALPGVVDAVGGRVPVLLDSGIRTGADVFKALALGARAVLLGRPYVYGLALADQRGVQEVIRNLLADFDLTMGLAGCASVREITPERIAPLRRSAWRRRRTRPAARSATCASRSPTAATFAASTHAQGGLRLEASAGSAALD